MNADNRKKISIEGIITAAVAVILIAAIALSCVMFIKASDTVTLQNTVSMNVAKEGQKQYGSDEELIEGVKDSVVEIYSTVSGGSSRGSGVITGGDESFSYITTCHHVVEGASEIVVRLTTGEEYAAQMVGGDPVGDIAVIKIEKTGLCQAVLGNSSELKLGETVFVIGNPLGSLGGTVSKGIVSALERTITISGIDEPMTLIQTDAAINSGNSGGAMFDSYGNLVGIVNAKSTGLGIEGIGFAIPVDTAKALSSELIETGGDGYGYIEGRYLLGATVADGYYTVSSGIFGQVQRIPVVYVSEINQDGSFYKAGIRANDIITAVEIDGVKTEISSSSAYSTAISSLDIEVGSQITLYVKADGNYNATEEKVVVDVLQYVYGK